MDNDIKIDVTRNEVESSYYCIDECVNNMIEVDGMSPENIPFVMLYYAGVMFRNLEFDVRANAFIENCRNMILDGYDKTDNELQDVVLEDFS